MCNFQEGFPNKIAISIFMDIRLLGADFLSLEDGRTEKIVNLKDTLVFVLTPW
jgi:hypothetical protein